MVLSSSVTYWVSIILQLILVIVLLRGLIWSVFWLLKKFFGIAVSVTSWSIMHPGYLSLCVKTSDLELHLNNIHLSLRVFDATCHHFVRISIEGIHVEYYHSNSSQGRQRATRSVVKPTKCAARVTRLKCFGFWCLRWLFRLVELSVKCLEAWLEEGMADNNTFICTVQVSGHLGLIIRPLRKKELAVAFDVNGALVQCLLKSDTPCPSTDDGLYPLAKLDFSSKLLVFLRPLALVPSECVQSIQINTLPMTLDFLHEDLISSLAQCVSSLSKKSDRPRRKMEEKNSNGIKFFPNVEMVFEDVSLYYHADFNDRKLTCKLTRMSVASKFSSSTQKEGVSSSTLDATINIQGVTMSDSLRRKSVSLKQVLLHMEKSSDVLSNHVQLSSLHASLWEEEAVFWFKRISGNASRTVAKLRGSTTSSTSANGRSSEGSSLSCVPKHESDRTCFVPFSVVTTVEASDWSVQVRMSAPSLQSKGPVLRGVMASSVGHVQWSPQEDHTSTIRASLRISDSYMHVPGYHLTVDNPSFFNQRVDDPSVLPSLHQHLWGRVASLGRLTLQMEKKVHVLDKHGREASVDDGKEDDAGGSRWGEHPLVLSGEGNCVMLEWSQPTVVMVNKVLEHYRMEYPHLFSRSSSSSSSTSPSSSSPLTSALSKSSFLSQLSPASLQLSFQITDFNMFLYSITPEPPCTMLRLDAATFSAPSDTNTDASSNRSTPHSSDESDLSHTASVNFHGLLVDSLRLEDASVPFQCSAVCNLAQGDGVALLDVVSLDYDHQVKNVDVDVKKVWLSWDTTHHMSLFHTACSVLEDLQMIRGTLSSASPDSASSSTGSSTTSPSSSTSQDQDSSEVVLLGSEVKKFLVKVPISLNVGVETIEGTARVDRGTRVDIKLDGSEVGVNGGVAAANCYQCELLFDKKKIVSIDKLVARFPHDVSVGEPPGGREKFKGHLAVENNEVLLIGANEFKLLFHHNHYFNRTFDKVMNVKKFLQLIHSRSGNGDGRSTDKNKKTRLLLPPDVQLECSDFIFQICDDPFEVKLRANYELLCDEYEQKTARGQALSKTIDQIKKERGEYAISAQETRKFYAALDEKNSKIFQQRVYELYDSMNMEDMSVFLFSMLGVKIRAMFDPSMLSRDKLVASISDMDQISPLPDNYQFSTLWGGYVSGMADSLEIQVRDYPYPVIGIEDVTISGRIVFAEQEAQEREKREAVVQVDKPWADVTIQRKLPPLKYYYDFEMTSSAWSMAYGPCLEPGMAQASNTFNLLTSPAVDPSKPLAYWDKLRLLFHGTIHLVTNELRVVLPSTFDPYNNVEYLELKLTGVDLQLLTNTKLTLSGAAQLLVHTASKYDECEVLSLPSVCASVNLRWCVNGGDPNRHHHVVRCAPDRLPIRSDKQDHDSYSCFRSYNLDLDFSVDVKAPPNKECGLPSVQLYSSTLRCLQQYQMLVKWNVTRPTKRGKYFNNIKPKRSPMLRHWRDVKLSVSFPKTIFRYWSSKALQRGVECCIDEAKLSLSLNLTLASVDSSLTQRKRANWTIRSLDGSGRGIVARVKRRTDITISSVLKEEDDVYVYTDSSSDHVTSMLLAINRVTYFRQDPSATGESEDRKYTHKLEAADIRVLWNSSNKDVVLGLYDSFKKNQELKRYLSTDALKSILSKKDLDMEKELNTLPVDKDGKTEGHLSPHSPRVRHPSSSGNTMLDQLLQDMSNQYVKYVDERAPSDPQLKGITAINMDDVTDSNWLITLQNTQVVLQGVEQPGYVLASSHLTDIIGCDHEPKMKNGVYVSKKSWVAKIQDLQYFTTQSVNYDLDYVPWLPASVISLPCMRRPDKNHSKYEADREANLNALLGTLGPSQGKKNTYVSFGEAAGGTVGSIRMNDLEDSLEEGVTDSTHIIQLQRVAPRCHCQVIYVTYGDQVEAEINRAASPAHSASPPRPSALSGTGDVDTFTFRYPSVEVHTTSSQYSLIMDIINNLLLHKESKKKDEVLTRHKFGLQLSSKVKDPRKAVLLQQNKVKKCVLTQRDAETKYFLEQKTERNPEKMKKLEEMLATSKEDLSHNSLKLSVLVRTFRQSQLYTASSSGSGTLTSEPMRRIEIWVDDTHWTLTHSDGQLPLADICFTNFSYNRMTFTDDSGEHRLELGTFKVRNLMPNIPQVYEQVLTPYDPNEKHLRVDKNVTLRVYCKDKAPVAGISVKEHLEVNVVPLTVRLTSRFYQTMQDFFFPKAEDLPDLPETDHSLLFGTMGSDTSQFNDGTDGNTLAMSRTSSLRRSTLSMSPSISSSRSNHSPPPTLSVNDLRKLDDVEKMKHRADKTKTFIYVKIPQVTVCVTYKSENVSFKDLQNQRVTVPTLEYHNRNWTWTDMLMEVKRDYKMAIVGQTIKSVIGMKGSSDEASGLGSPKLSRNADIIFGRHSPTAQSKLGKTKRLFSKKGSKDGDDISIKSEGKAPSSPPRTKYQPPLTDADITLKRSPRTLSKQSQSLDYSS